MADDVDQLAAWSWDTEFLNLLLPTWPRPQQDTDLLRQLGFIPGLKEVLMLRQVHALEHATVWLLSNQEVRLDQTSVVATDSEWLGGLSCDRGFYLYGQVHLNDLKRAVQAALHRLRKGEWQLAIHPRCGTNVSVGVALTAGLAVGFSLLLPRAPLEQLLGLGLAAATATHLTPELGSWAQRYLTTAIPFNLAIEKIFPVQDNLGRPAHFVQVKWITP